MESFYTGRLRDISLCFPKVMQGVKLVWELDIKTVTPAPAPKAMWKKKNAGLDHIPRMNFKKLRSHEQNKIIGQLHQVHCLRD